MSEACTHDCGNCSSDCGERTAPQSLNNANNKGVKKVIAVVSGKGGVGKSLVTSMLAVSAAKKGLKTAILASAVKQFWEEVDWGDVDCMFVDCPPGTGDVPLTIFQSLPVDGIVVVTSPQELVSMIVDKAVKMAQMMDIPVLGIVENMSYFKCPDCGNVHYIYGKSHVDEKAAEHGIDTVAKLPMDPQVAAKVDAGCAEDLDVSELSAIAQKIEDIQK